MARYFLDSSAIIKRYIALESGYNWMRSLCRASSGNQIIVADIAQVEVIAAFCRMVRENPPRLSAAARDTYIALFRRHLQRQYAVIPTAATLLAQAADLCFRHPLRAYDAVQLGCALATRVDAITIGVDVPIFVSADTNLLAIAATVGLPTDNPNLHP